MTNMLKKVFNWSDVHLSEMTSYKIHTLCICKLSISDFLLQVKQEVADDFVANLGFGSSTGERALSPNHPILGHDGTGAPSFGSHCDPVKKWPKLDCELVQASHRAKLFGT